ncbi:MAG: N-acetylmuramoyl-L-alanine amidase [Prevotella sp.]|nr:N-acetylmuramoyl-L-alanine amidase [Prevotella sp.]
MVKRLLFVILMMCSVGAFADTAAKKFVLVIDAGHGGKDAGCVGKISKEKNLTLKMALALGKMIERNCPDVKVIYTRKTDVFLELWQRAEIANKNKADLFISVHINALPGGKIARGFQTYTLGRGRNSGKKGIIENLEVAKRENSVIVMEKDYQQHYAGFDPNSPESNIMFEFIQDTYMERSVELSKFMQRYMCAATGRANAGAHQDNLAVLRLSSMPGCLLELGFISTSDEEQFMNSSDAPEKYARGFYNAFIAYKKKYFGGSATPFLSEPKTPSAPKIEQPAKSKIEQPVKDKTEPVKEQQSEMKKEQVSQSSASQGAPVFKVQIMADTKAVPVGSSRFKGLKDIDSYKEGGYYKYTIGSSTDYNEIYRLRKSLLDKFPGAFIIAFKNGEKMDVTQAIREFKARRSQ